MAPEELEELLLRAVPELATGVWSLERAEPLLSVHRGRGQRFTTCTLTWTDHVSQTTASAHLVIKQDRRWDFRWADRAARLLHSGFGSGARSQVATPFGVCSPGVLVTERVPALSLLATLLAAANPGEAAPAVQRAADWLLDLQALAVALPTSTSRGLHSCAPQLVEVAAVAGPAHAQALARLAGLLQTAAHDEQVAPNRLVASHGDLHPANLFVAATAMTAIDFDTAASREAAYDAGYAVAHLVITPLLAGGPAELAVAAAGQFWDAYRHGGGAATDESIAMQAARALVQSLHFELVTFSTGRLDLINFYTAGALALLEHGRGGLDLLAAQLCEGAGLPKAAAG